MKSAQFKNILIYLLLPLYFCGIADVLVTDIAHTVHHKLNESLRTHLYHQHYRTHLSGHSSGANHNHGLLFDIAFKLTSDKTRQSEKTKPTIDFKKLLDHFTRLKAEVKIFHFDVEIFKPLTILLKNQINLKPSTPPPR